MAQISKIQVLDIMQALCNLAPFQAWLEQEQSQLASCHVSYHQLKESMLLASIRSGPGIPGKRLWQASPA
jgi:hypothetical protein